MKLPKQSKLFAIMNMIRDYYLTHSAATRVQSTQSDQNTTTLDALKSKISNDNQVTNSKV
jgi:hypothetical protein